MPPKFQRKVAARQQLRQPTPKELTDDCLNILRRKFYNFPGGDKAFYQQRRDLLRRVVLWPAAWLNNKGVTLHGDAYRAIFTKVFLQAAAHVETKIKYPPAYLAQVIQSHFKIHGEEYYEAAKATRDQVDHVLMMVGQLAQQAKPAPDPVRQMAEAVALFKAPKRALKSTVKPAGQDQPNLL
jgi:hypothetical protein